MLRILSLLAFVSPSLAISSPPLSASLFVVPPSKAVTRQWSPITRSFLVYPAPRSLRPNLQRKRAVCMGLFGLGAPEIVVIFAVAAFVLGPEKLAAMAKDAGQGLGGMQEVPKGFNEGFQQGSTSEETKELVRSLGKTVVTVKDTAGDLAGEYKAVATEFSEGVRQGAQEVNKELVGGLKETNKVVAQTRTGMKEIIGSTKDAEVVEKKKN